VIESKWFRGACIAGALLMAATLFAGAEEAGKVQLFPAPWDKLVHFLYYGTMAALLSHGVGRRWLWLPLVLVPLAGALDEWHQVYVPGRDASFFDWMADGLGTVLFVYAYSRLTKNRTRDWKGRAW
jgi:VanZ family protein